LEYSIMSRIEAISRQGVFEPLEPVSLRDEQRVQLSFEPANGNTPQAWLSQVKAIQATIVKRQGVLPDSATEIAADRKLPVADT
jgi:predicted DNA-binding antitoxin AbrB/MazE fold protein